ncbi:hypothetical protein DRQ15_05875 [candidate division KSB1 bacterium]|nr:hypothetical protein [bacterium]OQX59067.1 MAG: hypothetical protein B5M50_03480 [candidate division KSB1 bacterium 4484_219]RKY80826.1 MAG: hypothetical protein DRQ00_01490 [candidate division KSB1 bacterium]HDI52131.1 hypothetical protein [Bacteroidota bacterium]RKY85533.1 MAG: hypothetical protein DRQ11_09785 [candidate division KSB1 bacterium]
MSFTYEELKHKTVAELREIAAGLDHEALRGYTQLNKEHLLAALCKALNIDMHVHHAVVGIDKTRIKAQIRELKKKRDEAIAAHNRNELKSIRRQIHDLKKALRKAAV